MNDANDEIYINWYIYIFLLSTALRAIKIATCTKEASNASNYKIYIVYWIFYTDIYDKSNKWIMTIFITFQNT